MDRVRKFIALLILLIGNEFTFGQDTLFYDDRRLFDQEIKYSYMDYHRTMPMEVVNQIDSVFKTIDFNDPEIPCEYDFGFMADLDSCGNITNCAPLNNRITNEKMILFETKVNSLLLHSNWRINSVVLLSDTSYQFNHFHITVNISCSPDEIIIAPEGWDWDKGKILALRKKEDLVIFDDFKNNCPK